MLKPIERFFVKIFRFFTGRRRPPPLPNGKYCYHCGNEYQPHNLVRFVYCRHCQQTFVLANFDMDRHPPAAFKCFFSLCEICQTVSPKFHSFSIETAEDGSLIGVHIFWSKENGEVYEWYQLSDRNGH